MLPGAKPLGALGVVVGKAGRPLTTELPTLGVLVGKLGIAPGFGSAGIAGVDEAP